jgi:general bacterial porin, GBP family
LSATGSWGGMYFAHSGDNDNLNATISLNNSVKFQSDNYAGLSFNGAYAFSNQAGGFAQNRAYSGGVGYSNGGLKLGAAYLQLQGLDSANAKGAIDGLPDSSAAALPGVQNQRTWGLGASYAFDAAVIGGVFTQTRLQDKLWDATIRYNNFEVNARYKLTAALGLGAVYNYTQVLASANGQRGSGHWNQFGLQSDYALSKRTNIYLESVAMLGANGQAGVGMTQIYGTDAPSTSRNQVVVSSGIRHSF